MIPQNTRGDQYVSLALTPINASSALVIDFASDSDNPLAQSIGFRLLTAEHLP